MQCISSQLLSNFHHNDLLVNKNSASILVIATSSKYTVVCHAAKEALIAKQGMVISKS